MEDPVFIGGLQRSGTSLMRAIVGSHPDVAIFEWDLPLWTYFYRCFKNKDLSSPNVVSELLTAIFENTKIKACDVPLARDKIENRICQDRRPITCGLVFEHVLTEYAMALDRPRWGLKTPYNEFFAEDIFAAHPDARMIQLIRDPRDVAVSFRSYDGGGWRYCAKDHIASWKNSAKISRLNTERFKGRYLCVRYEDLVREPLKTVHEVCRTLQLGFLPEMMAMNGHLGWKGNNSFFDDIGSTPDAISTNGIARYTSQLDPDVIILYQKMLREDLLQFGYPLQRIDLRRHASYYFRRASGFIPRKQKQ